MKSNPLAIKTLAFFLIWLLLSESFDWLHVSMGVLCAFGVAWFNRSREQTRFEIPRARIVWYYFWLVGRILQSGFHLSKLILHPSLPIDPRMIRQRTKLRKDAGIVLLGNSITLTPGTITVEVNSDELEVHAMDAESAEDVTSFRFDEQIARVTSSKETA
ncbi:MAG: Na+/H+ antiporter subunit E [Planctomycetes bacterium]|nr:Na+/H+ antiporter subunit E [Planctomycetota bacterium]